MLANVLGLLVGFMLGVLIRSSAGALVAYFVYSFLLPTLAIILAGSQALVPRTCSPGSTSSYAAGTLIDGTVTAQQWAHLGVTSVIWLVVPLTVGLGRRGAGGGQVGGLPEK